MPRTKKTTRKSRSHEMIDTKTEDLVSTLPGFETGSGKHIWSARVRWAGALLVIILVGLFLFKKGYIVAAVVNGKPIFRWELSQQLTSRFGQQALESMITEKLIADAAQKDGVRITQAEVSAKMDDIVKTLGPNVKLEDLLKYQGMTQADFEQQIKLQLTVERILGKDVAVTDSDIDAFIKENKATMTATEASALRDEARTSLVSQKISEKIQPWLTDLKSKANITKMLP